MESEEFEEKMACKIHVQLYNYLIKFQWFYANDLKLYSNVYMTLYDLKCKFFYVKFIFKYFLWQISLIVICKAQWSTAQTVCQMINKDKLGFFPILIAQKLGQVTINYFCSCLNCCAPRNV